MTISQEELEKIKKLYKAKDLGNILQPDEDSEDETNNEDDSDDENFISNRASDGKKSDIKPVNVDIRSLDNEVGGTEVDYEAIQEENNQDVDVWDNREEQIDQGLQEGAEEDIEANISFIHSIKTGTFRGKKRRKTMGQVDLGEAASEAGEEKPAGFVQRLQQLKEDRSNEGGGIGF